ncbi:meiotic coiled-coil protein [Reticulomyxa filosa]|uniref:Meiotic coiled-coil protein n=1 Tax=Reticulomyxa filosa TaxID=46433 RepID=X6MBX6_RETFI|nr:meiotic coiled-coil protein [Reticulomyxa filosa]|eukprot:ETO11181.1 meiotic coiled-coil protein [Reticulomyxa filosa]
MRQLGVSFFEEHENQSTMALATCDIQKEVFTRKDVEKLLKESGIGEWVVKQETIFSYYVLIKAKNKDKDQKEEGMHIAIQDTITALVDEGKVHEEKIGTSNYLWAFQSEALVQNMNSTGSLKKEIENLEKKIAQLEKNLEAAKAQRADVSCRFMNHTFFSFLFVVRRTTRKDKHKSYELAAFSNGITKFNEDLQKYNESDSVDYEGIKNAVEKAKEAMEHWTDNIFSIAKKIKERGTSNEEFFKAYELSADFDYVE